MNIIERIIKLEETVRRLLARPFILYDKGTYTPTYLGGTTAGATTYSFQDAAWTRIGRVVVVRGQIIWTASTGTGNAQVSLPFAPSGGNFAGSLHLTGVTFANSAPELIASPGNTFFTMLSPLTNAGGAIVQMEAAGQIVFTVTYFVA